MHLEKVLELRFKGESVDGRLQLQLFVVEVLDRSSARTKIK
jgi:hypothetical protein